MNLFDLCVYKNLNKGSGGDVDVSSLVATENKTYNAGTGKAYNPVVVNVPEKQLTTLNADENKTYSPPSGYDGFSEVTVYVPYVTQGTTINENGTYTPPEGVDGFGRVIVDVPTPPPSLQSLTASHNGYFLPSSGYVGFSEVNVDVALPQNAYLLESQKNDVVTIQHGAEFDMPKLIASIEPQQDLHGYDAPWVGGAGKNKCPVEKFADGNSNNFTLSAGSYTFSFRLLGSARYSTSSIVLYDSSNNEICAVRIYGVSVNSYMDAQFTLSESKTLHIANSNVIVGSGGYAIDNVQIENGDSRTTFAPYSNECPISGWTACNVVRTGANLWDEEWELGIYNTSTGEKQADNSKIRSKNYISVKPSNSYRIVIPSSAYCRYFCYDINKNLIITEVNQGSVEITTPNNCYFMTFNMEQEYGTTYNNDISINYPSTDTEYHAYNGNTYTINFVDGSSPLTVYKGELDVLSGLLKAYPHYDSYNGETINGEWISDRDAYSVGATPTIGAEVQVISGSDYTTYQQTANNVKSLEGVNNIFADTGEVDVQIWTKEVTS